jgi:ABC-type nitrate/sulfonate/bicarbonate transport system permease component
MLEIRKKLPPQTDILFSIGGIVLLITVWCIATYGGFVKPLFLPSPTGIWEGVMGFHERNWLFPAILRSTWRVTQALFLVLIVGVPVGLLMGAFPPIDAFLRPLINGGKSIPTTGIIGLIVLWFSIEERAKIVFLFLGAIFYMIILVKNAVESVSEEYLRVAKDIGANGWQTVQRVLIPGALPQIWDAIAVCSGIMWTYIVLAEFINASEEQLGLGYLLYVGSRANESGRVFAVLIIIAIVSSLTDWILQTVRKRYLNW